MEYNEKIAEYYDLIYGTKDYRAEVDFIEKITGGIKNKKILDVGCGTGNHSVLYRDRQAYSVLGIDISPSMINVAKTKVKTSNSLNFKVSSIEDQAKLLNRVANGKVIEWHRSFWRNQKEKNTFDIVTSLFNVVNHIKSLKELMSFFECAASLVHTSNGYFIFDCWNGAAAIRDLPKQEHREIKTTDVSDIMLDIFPETDLMRSLVEVTTKIQAIEVGSLVDSYEFKLDHILWTPKTFIDLIQLNNLELCGIYKAFNTELTADIEDYKIVFVCQGQRVRTIK